MLNNAGTETESVFVHLYKDTNIFCTYRIIYMQTSDSERLNKAKKAIGVRITIFHIYFICLFIYVRARVRMCVRACLCVCMHPIYYIRLKPCYCPGQVSGSNVYYCFDSKGYLDE